MTLLKHLLPSHLELLEVRSADEWTPLLVAACLNNLEAIEAILAAGADPLATDSLGRNLLHAFLLPPNGTVNDSREQMKKLMELLDSSAHQHLLQQRCTEHPGSLTPLMRWLYGWGALEHFRPNPNGALQILLEHSEKSDLEMVDTRGLTPLHIVGLLASRRTSFEMNVILTTSRSQNFRWTVSLVH